MSKPTDSPTSLLKFFGPSSGSGSSPPRPAGASVEPSPPRVVARSATSLTIEFDPVDGAQSHHIDVAEDSWNPLSSWTWRSYAAAPGVNRVVVPDLQHSKPYACRLTATAGVAKVRSEVVRAVATLTPDQAAIVRLQDEKRQLAAEVARLKEDNRARREQMARYRASFDGITALHSKQDELFSKNAELTAAVAAKDQEIERLKGQIESLVSPAPAVPDNREAELLQLRRELADAEAQLEKQYALYVTRESALMEELDAKRVECSRLAAEVAGRDPATSAASRVSELEEAVRASRADAAVARREADALRLERDAFADEVRHLREYGETLATRVTDLRSALMSGGGVAADTALMTTPPLPPAPPRG